MRTAETILLCAFVSLFVVGCDEDEQVVSVPPEPVSPIIVPIEAEYGDLETSASISGIARVPDGLNGIKKISFSWDGFSKMGQIGYLGSAQRNPCGCRVEIVVQFPEMDAYWLGIDYPDSTGQVYGSGDLIWHQSFHAEEPVTDPPWDQLIGRDIEMTLRFKPPLLWPDSYWVEMPEGELMSASLGIELTN